MIDDERVKQRLLAQAQAYSRLYPSVAPRLRAALAAGDDKLRGLVEALASALDRADAHRARLLRDVWNLSPKEIDVTLHLVDGGTVASCAEAMDIAESTIRTHLKSVFAKTGRNRQSQLASLLQNSATASDSTETFD